MISPGCAEDDAARDSEIIPPFRNDPVGAWRRSGGRFLTLSNPHGQLRSQPDLLLSTGIAVGMWSMRLRRPSAPACPNLPASLRSGAPQALAGKTEPVGIVDETIEHGVCTDRIVNQSVLSVLLGAGW